MNEPIGKHTEEEKADMIYAEFMDAVMFYSPDAETFLKLAPRMARFIDNFIRYKTTLRSVYGTFINGQKGYQQPARSAEEILGGIVKATEDAIRKDFKGYEAGAGGI